MDSLSWNLELMGALVLLPEAAKGLLILMSLAHPTLTRSAGGRYIGSFVWHGIASSRDEGITARAAGHFVILSAMLLRRSRRVNLQQYSCAFTATKPKVASWTFRRAGETINQLEPPEDLFLLTPAAAQPPMLTVSFRPFLRRGEARRGKARHLPAASGWPSHLA